MQTNLQDKVVCVTGAARRACDRIGVRAPGRALVIHHNASDADAASAAAEARRWASRH